MLTIRRGAFHVARRDQPSSGDASVLTGALFPPERNATRGSRSDFPCYAAACSIASVDGIPSGVTLPNPCSIRRRCGRTERGQPGLALIPAVAGGSKQPQQGDPTLTLPTGFTVDRILAAVAVAGLPPGSHWSIADREEFSDSNLLWIC
ncbi:MAG: hypothetical protein R3C17_18060 [Planctomycetaceae bacterium]